MAFAEGKVYKITSVADGSVLDLTANKTTNGVGVITYAPHGRNNQKWLATKIGSGWEISPIVQAGEKKCLDQDVGNATLVDWVCHKRTNQQWNANEVSPGAKVYTITSVRNGKCLANTGRGKVVKLESPVQSNSQQYWTIQQI